MFGLSSCFWSSLGFVNFDNRSSFGFEVVASDLLELNLSSIAAEFYFDTKLGLGYTSWDGDFNTGCKFDLTNSVIFISLAAYYRLTLLLCVTGFCTLSCIKLSSQSSSLMISSMFSKNSFSALGLRICIIGWWKMSYDLSGNVVAFSFIWRYRDWLMSESSGSSVLIISCSNAYSNCYCCLCTLARTKFLSKINLHSLRLNLLRLSQTLTCF